MAPDLNAVAGGERFDYSQPGSSGYHIKQDMTWMLVNALAVIQVDTAAHKQQGPQEPQAQGPYHWWRSEWHLDGIPDPKVV